ncbi:MAG: hypothetical protein ABI473_07855 [Candidatus Dormibacter sp.]
MSSEKGAPKRRDHMARVFCTDEAWTAFRLAAQQREIASSTYLGQLVSQEVLRLEAAAAKDEKKGAKQALAALDEARILGADITRLTARLEWLAGKREPAAVPPAPAVLRTAGGVPDLDDWSQFRLDSSSTEAADVPDWEP